jgi:hypothetical protein
MKISWAAKMALIYRIEKKKIIRNQIDLISYILQVLKELVESKGD